MINASPLVLSLLGALAVSAAPPGPEAGPGPTATATTGAAGPVCVSQGGPVGCYWTVGCFPRCGCPDDYCPNPYPRQCWPPYPPFYRCVPAGKCAHPPCVGVGNENLTWWWIPTPRALRDALWCEP